MISPSRARARVRLAAVVSWTVFAATVGLVLAAFETAVRVGDIPLPLSFGLRQGVGIELSRAVGALAYATVGLLIINRRPSHLIGWVMLLLGLDSAVEDYTIWYAISAVLGVTIRDRVDLALWFASWHWVVMNVPTSIMPLIFPNGQLPSRRWLPALFLSLAAMTLQGIGYAYVPGYLYLFPGFPNTLAAPEAYAGLLRVVIGLSLGMVGAATVLAALSVVARYRGAGVRQRQQLKWFAFAAVLVTIMTLIEVTLRSTVDPALVDLGPITVVFFLSLVSIPVAVGIAMLRHRLYDIDVLIRRTLVYSVVSGVLLAVYLAAIVVLQALLHPLTGGSQLAISLSIVAVVAAFQPVRTRIKRWVDRRFYRSRYNAEKMLDRFASRLQDELDLEALRSELLAVVDEALEPRHASLWVRSGPLAEAERSG